MYTKKICIYNFLCYNQITNTIKKGVSVCMRNKIISLFLSILMLIGIIGPSIEVVYAEGNNLPINNENISTKSFDDFNTKESCAKLEEDNIIKPTDELSENKDKVNKKDIFLTENLEKMSGAEKAPGGNNLTEVYLDSAKGDDNGDGSVEHPVKTFAKAIEKAKYGDTLNVLSLTEKNLTVNKKITLKFLEDVTMQGSGTGITLKEGSHLCVAEGKTLNISGYNKGILVEKGAEINDGNYVFKFPKSGFAFETSGNILGTSKDKLKMDITNGYFYFHSKDNELRNATINQRYDDDKWELYEWNGFKAFNSEINLYRLPVYFKGPLYLDNTKFVIDGKGVRYQTGAYFENSWEVGEFHFTNNSIFEVKNFNTHWRAKGITFGYDNKVLVDKGAKIVVKNNKNGGFNDNQGIATFNGGYLEGDGHSGSLFGAQDKANTKIIFGADSVVNTPMKSDSDNGLGQSGTNYIVIGGSHKVKYSPNYQGGLAVPVNGEENGNEKLTWFQLKDKSIDKLAPINKNGKTYDYSVKNPSDDGNKYVWTPKAKATFKLNNNDASFSDNTNKDKEFKTIRGYKLDDVVGNVNPGVPTDKNGVKFLGWFYKTASGEEKAFNWNEKLTADTEVYAKWQRKTVIYHNGAGKDYISSVSKDAKDIEVLSFDDILKEKADFKVEGKKFAGWTTAPDGSGKVYKAKDKIDFTEGKSQIDLYAKYTDDEYKVSFSANGGTFSENSIFKKNKDVFTIEKDKNGGDVAVLKKTAKYNDKLFDLLNGLDHNSLKPDKDAKKDCYTVKNADNWYIGSESSSGTIRFDDYEEDGFFGKTNIKGTNPQITKDTTYYLSWNDDNSGQCKPIENEENNKKIDADFTENANKGKKSVILYDDKEFSLTTDFVTDKIKSDIENIKNSYKDREEDKISLSSLSSNFEIKVVLPNGIEVSKNPSVTVNGLGNLLKIDSVKSTRDFWTDQTTVTVNLGLKDSFTNYKALNNAVKSLGTNPSESSVGDNKISVALNGLKLKDYNNIEDKKKFKATSSINGSIKTVVKSDSGIKNFMNSYKTSQDLSLNLTVSKPIEFTLDGDLLVKGKDDKTLDTTKDAPYAVDEGDSLTFAGELNVKSIKDQIQLLKDSYAGDSNTITTENVKSEFVASIEVPEGLEIPQNPKATLTDNNLFKVESTQVNGNKVLVKMTLKNNNYTKFDDLYDDVAGTNAVPDKLQVEVSGIKVKENLTSNTLTVKGSVKGSFRGQATKEGMSQTFNFTWGAKQDAVGKDSKQDPSSSDAIQLTLKLPEKLTLNGDILIGDDTEHNALHEVKAGDVLEYTGRLDVSSIKNKIKFLKESYAGDSDTIKTENIKSEFVAELTIPEGLEIPADLKATLTDNNLFEIKNGDVKRDGNKIIVKMTLKNGNYTKFSDLYNDVTSVPDKLDLKVPNIKVNDNVSDGSKLTVVGKVNGNFKGKATSQFGKKEVYNFKWIAEQTEKGKDFLIKDQNNNKTIQYTILVKNQVKPTPKPEPKPEPKPDHKYYYYVKTGEPTLNIDDHYAYMKCYPDNTFGPDKPMTRAEVTMMFARLLKERPEKGRKYIMPYKDIHENDWYAYAVTFMSEKKLVSGYPDGTFKPNAPITRAEFASIASRFDSLADKADLKFSDVSKNHWAYKVICSAEAKGWISGYPDGTFKPEKNITRAEVVSSTNRILNRYADLDFAKAHVQELAPMIDMNDSHWAYGPIVEAMNGHDYKRLSDGKSERWIRLNGKRFTFPIPPYGEEK